MMMRFFFMARVMPPNAKLTDDEERAKDARLGARGCPPYSSFDPTSCSALLSFQEIHNIFVTLLRGKVPRTSALAVTYQRICAAL
jgi:hypothetical protein